MARGWGWVTFTGWLAFKLCMRRLLAGWGRVHFMDWVTYLSSCRGLLAGWGRVHSKPYLALCLAVADCSRVGVEYTSQDRFFAHCDVADCSRVGVEYTLRTAGNHK